MNSPKKAIEFSKAVLNVTTYEPYPGNEFAEVRQNITIDITDLLRENGVDEICQVNGVSAIEGEEGLMMLPTFTGAELRLLEKKIHDVIDATIVNDKQGKAIKAIISGEIDKYFTEHWDPITECKFAKDYIDEQISKEIDSELKKNK